ncbi:helix-turn-helix domain-containing protein [Pseudovibrio sp. Tun.PSC04-5.I4]|uniref:helix-turn-helix domain-containing protein n=1 Tax=Pseudovibrio sp. Tun.PSC04-5.I4 TaxID=1798213 RepID=UPI000B0CF801|nr:helix-turn-helix domain-containing protein [Pseudovibrio sp. Tun.PSC04-5.I4]
MSVQAITWAYQCTEITDPIEKFVLVTIANFADEYGLCWPSQAALQEACCCCERKLRNCLTHLEEVGLITRYQRRRANGSRRSDIFILTGFADRKPITDTNDHPALENLPAIKPGTTNRHHVPDGPSSNRHVVPHQPACGAATNRHVVPPLNRHLEPSKEPFPPIPQNTTCEQLRAKPKVPAKEKSHEQSFRSHEATQRKKSISLVWQRAWDEALTASGNHQTRTTPGATDNSGD